jgi:hypothetical protein
VTDRTLDRGIAAAFTSLLRLYEEHGGHNYYGYRGQGDERNYKGPVFWTEGDCQYQLALALEQQFPGMVHIEMPVAHYMRWDYNTEKHRRQFVDVVVSDLSGFDTERDCFAKRTDDLFVEVKYAGNSSPPYYGDKLKRIFHPNYLPADLERCAVSVADGWCRRAAVLLVDDNDLLNNKIGRLEELPPWAVEKMPWSTKVTRWC